ncbi:MAG TPA: hypothetical protein VKU00_00485 [Chthonomonadaceae bacterium]|nr:hypothetical protein [Chthonomonadaceae bacterium]
MTATQPLRCKCRRQAVTSLRCSRCSVPICPDCSIPAAVGMLCRECASNKKSRLYQVSAGSMALAIPACLLAAAFGGWLLTSIGMGFGFFGIAFGFLYGLAIAEIALRITGRKRGLTMEILAGGSAFLGIIAGWLITDSTHPLFNHAYFLWHLSNPWSYVLLGVAIFGAVNRIRNI